MLQRLEPQGQKEKRYGTQLQDRASATWRKTKHRDWTWTENDSKGFKGGLHTTRYKVTGLIFQKAAWFTGELKRKCENSCLVQAEYQRRMTVAINLKLMLGLVVCLASCVTHRLEPCPERRASKQIALSRPATSTKPSAKNANKTAAIEKASYTRKICSFSVFTAKSEKRGHTVQCDILSHDAVVQKGSWGWSEWF